MFMGMMTGMMAALTTGMMGMGTFLMMLLGPMAGLMGQMFRFGA